MIEVQENAGRPSQKKLGKCKADEVETGSKRPTKKAKEAEARVDKPAKPSATKGKVATASKKDGKSKSDKPKSKKQPVRFEDEDEGAGSSEGWEDVEDDGDLQKRAK